VTFAVIHFFQKFLDFALETTEKESKICWKGIEGGNNVKSNFVDCGLY